MFWHVLVKAEIILIFSCCALGLLKGGHADRIGSLLILLAYIACNVALALAGSTFPTTAIFICDFVLAISLLVVALRYSSLWLGCAMMLQSIALCSQGLAFGGEGLGAHEQLWLNNCVSMLMMACIVAGSISSWRRRVKARSVVLSHTPGQPSFSPS
jgi:hypothetical protein